ncbi:hypothetical protein EMIHUDRAFT_241437 [Emiliania huxleyi CCMP1516]|uniref:Sulfatase N-terminal domain-containing protein n=2 Tax=Emiliania huxleyi TaxID=2903 RepID=A0A0D3JCL6_EMIH1|nr:hypothetical protein EMIHUDRAFT_241437 [Emiliania huxleyi CCMP1516]EOD21251.1 hypothetical protein EMIHUDRAFT_241437 [Emiliania huxleyi CCMP1516]|eukprot:XP_005773680.1 hypothetical protein EMIHUDRAFT_241437 [Emiliania huxleyi CCMP1516]
MVNPMQGGAHRGAPHRPRGVLYLLADDLRPEFGFTTRGKMLTPNIDGLVAQAAVFSRAYCQVALCIPSRASFLTGRRPRAHWGEASAKDVLRSQPTIVSTLRDAGYNTAGIGKISHFGESGLGYTLPFPTHSAPLLERTCFTRSDAKNVRRLRYAISAKIDYYSTMATCDLPWGGFPDQRVVNGATLYLKKLAACRGAHSLPQTQRELCRGWGIQVGAPFLVMVGFMRPHNPIHYPPAFLDMQPKASTRPEERVAGAPFEYHIARPPTSLGGPVKEQDTLDEMRRHYRGAVSYVDHLIGVLLSNLRKQHLWNDTIVVLHSDHSFSLGENAAWQKLTAFEHALRVPLIMRVPWMPKARGRRVDDVVELIDVMPTLLDALGVQPSARSPSASPAPTLDGKTLLPLMRGQARACREPLRAYSQAFHSGRMAYSVRTEHYRYTRWVEWAPAEDWWRAASKPALSCELFNHTTDRSDTVSGAFEAHNLASGGSASRSEEVERVAAFLDAQLQGLSRPYADACD